MSSTLGDRALVLGGSFTALLAASSLARHFQEVVLVDRDQLTGMREARRGAPQARHINGLLARGMLAMEELYPGSWVDLVRGEEAPLTDLSGTVRWYFNGQRLRQVRAGLTCMGCRRPVMEAYLRERAQALPNVRFIEEADIVGITATSGGVRVTGARIQPHAEGSAEQVVEADLVVDTTGRGSRAAVWLEELGYPRVREDQTKVGLGYASRHYRMRTDPFGKDHSINPVASPTLPRGAIFTKTDSGLAELTVYGLLGDHPPVDPDGFNAFVKTLAAPEIHESIIQAEPIDDPVLFRFPTTLWRRFDLLPRFPAGLLVMGDAVCTPNPVYAQAQTLSALEAIRIGEHLRRGSLPDTLAFQRDVADIIRPAWEMTSSVDLSFPGVEGKRTLPVKLQHAYMRRLQLAATRDPAITAAFMRAAGLVDPPDALLRPAMVWRVLRNSKRRPARRPASTAEHFPAYVG